MTAEPWRPHSTVRYRPDVGFELRCDDCAAQQLACYWPLTLEFWYPVHGMTRCRACWQKRDTAAHRRRYQEPDRRNRLKARSARNRRRAKLAAFHALRRVVA